MQLDFTVENVLPDCHLISSWFVGTIEDAINDDAGKQFVSQKASGENHAKTVAQFVDLGWVFCCCLSCEWSRRHKLPR